MDNTVDVTDSLVQELRRGTIVLGVLSQLEKPRYGYSLAQSLGEMGMEIEQSTLYPLLRRLEKQGLLISDWSTEGSRPRRYYQISDEGRKTLRELTAEWKKLNRVVDGLMDL